jgi:uncharacterized protein (TIGR02996 family)
MPGLPDLMDALARNPDDRERWLALAAWYQENGRGDEAAAVRVFWPSIRDNLAFTPLETALDDLAHNARLLADIAQEIEERSGR